jgi:hypothetical protein
VILFLLSTNDVTICMELDPDIHIGSTWFVLETGCDRDVKYECGLLKYKEKNVARLFYSNNLCITSISKK